MIKIKEDYQYFTHLPAKESIIPLSNAISKIYPTRVLISSKKEQVAIDLSLTDIEKFTHVLQIEKQRVEFFCKAKEGYVHFHLFAKDGFIYIKLHRGIDVSIVIKNKTFVLKKGKQLQVCEAQTIEKKSDLERISFGCTKAPILENNINRESKLYLLSQLIPSIANVKVDLKSIEVFLIDLFAPQSEDVNFTGAESKNTDLDKFSLFSSFNQMMREKIISEDDKTIFFMPGIKNLPQAGRVMSIQTKDLSFDLLWKKNKILRCIITPSENCEKKLHFSKSVKKYRLKKALNQKGAFKDADAFLTLEKGQRYFVDRIIY